MYVDIFLIVGQLYCFFVVFLMACYSVRHFIFTYNRGILRQAIDSDLIIDSDILGSSVLIPMHNEELVCHNIIECLQKDEFAALKCQIVAINDHSQDRTEEILNKFCEENPNLQSIHRYEGIRGKPSGLNDALELTKNNTVIIFDADYLPQPGLVRYLSMAFIDPEVGLTMGRVVPINEGKNLLTRLISFERSAGYQIDQQARYNIKTMPQYGGTVGGFRKDVIEANDKFSPYVLAEDTDVTVRLFSGGWKIHYQNGAECYEEAVEEWRARGIQIQRWSRGHNQVMFARLKKLMKSPYLSFKEKLDAFLTLIVYFVPLLLSISIVITVFIFYFGKYHIHFFTNYIIIASLYFGLGNMAPFHQIAAALILDNEKSKVKILPLMFFSMLLSTYYSSKGALWAIRDQFTNAIPKWNKTQRFRKN